MWASSGQCPTRASPWSGTIVYWHEDTGVATAGKHRSDVCSTENREKGITRVIGEKKKDFPERLKRQKDTHSVWPTLSRDKKGWRQRWWRRTLPGQYQLWGRGDRQVGAPACWAPSDLGMGTLTGQVGDGGAELWKKKGKQMRDSAN